MVATVADQCVRVWSGGWERHGSHCVRVQGGYGCGYGDPHAVLLLD